MVPPASMTCRPMSSETMLESAISESVAVLHLPLISYIEARRAAVASAMSLMFVRV